MKSKKTVLAAVLTGILLYGCRGLSGSDTFVPEANSIYIAKDGTIFSAMVESYGEGNYQQDEFEQFLMNELSSYNADAGSDSAFRNTEGSEPLPVSLTSSELKEGRAVAVYQYRDAESFLDFTKNYNEVLCQVLNLETDTVLNGKSKGWLTGKEWQKPAKTRNSESSKAESSELDKLDKGRIVLIETENPVLIQTEGTILYMTKDIVPAGKNTAQIPAGTHYIIFK